MEQQPILVISVLISFTILGVVLGRMTSTKSVDDFALGGRSLGFFPSLMTLSGTFVSAVTLMVYTSFVYIYGISAAWIFVGYTLGFLFFIPFALKLYRLSLDHNFFTLTDYFVFRYGRRTARWVIGVIFIWYVGLLSTQLLVGSNLLNEMGGIPVNWAKLGMLVTVLVYLLVGGFGSVVKTDIFQFLVIFLVLILVTMTLNRGGDVPPEMYNPFNAGPVNIIAFLLLGVKNIFWLAARNNKGIVVLVNKWDLVDKQTNTIKAIEQQIKKEIEPFSDVPIVFISSLTKQRIFKAIETAMTVYKNRSKKIVTRKFNDCMLPIIEKNPPPAYKGKYVKIKFCTQLPSSFPQFAFFCNLPQYIKDPYKRFIENKIREIYDFSGTPIRIFFRKK